MVGLAGGKPPGDKIIDGKDIRPLMLQEDKAASSYEAFFYYFRNNLEAVRMGKWKYHVRKGEDELQALYDLESDIGETNNVYGQFPEIVSALEQAMEACRRDLGDEARGIEGLNCRPIGRVEEPDTLTHYDSNHPYVVAMYDLEDAG